MRRFRIRMATSADWRALAEMRYRFRTELGSPAEPKSRFVRRCTSWMKKRFRVSSGPWRCWVLDDGKQLLGHVCVQLFEKLPNPVKDEPELHAYITNLMLSRKYEARDLEKGCWTKRCHGVALREPTRLFSGRLLKVDPFIVGAAWLNLRIFSSCGTVCVYRARLVRQRR